MRVEDLCESACYSQRNKVNRNIIITVKRLKQWSISILSLDTISRQGTPDCQKIDRFRQNHIKFVSEFKTRSRGENQCSEINCERYRRRWVQEQKWSCKT